MTAPTPEFTYAASGVDTDIEAEASAILYGYAKQTWGNRAGKLGEPIAQNDNFSGLKFAEIGQLPDGTVSFGNADGLGTKPEFARAAGRYDTIATDLVAAVADDAAIIGAEPAHMITVLKVNTLGQDRSRLPIIEELASGYLEPAKKAGIAVINGELAQTTTMGEFDKFKFNWDATLTWFAHESRLIDGSDIRPGDYLVGLAEDGIRCNGISLARTVLQTILGERWGEMDFYDQRMADAALTPSTIYSGAIVDMTGGADLDRKPKAVLHGAAHITGGGLPEKLLYRVLNRRGFGAIIDNPIEAPQFLRYIQGIGRISDHEAYRTWHMGQGMVLITPEPDDVMDVADQHGIESQVIGQVSRDPQSVIESTGLYSDRLTYEPR
jgi:phosphoribosylformylglycinamidine cyclo-ligase